MLEMIYMHLIYNLDICLKTQKRRKTENILKNHSKKAKK